jgi:hypothetical protein
MKNQEQQQQEPAPESVGGKAGAKGESVLAHTEKLVLEHYDRAVEIFQQRLGDTHPETRNLIIKTQPALVSLPLECFVL